jgi:hypothetical protein
MASLNDLMREWQVRPDKDVNVMNGVLGELHGWLQKNQLPNSTRARRGSKG